MPFDAELDLLQGEREALTNDAGSIEPVLPVVRLAIRPMKQLLKPFRKEVLLKYQNHLLLSNQLFPLVKLSGRLIRRRTGSSSRPPCAYPRTYRCSSVHRAPSSARGSDRRTVASCRTACVAVESRPDTRSRPRRAANFAVRGSGETERIEHLARQFDIVQLLTDRNHLLQFVDRTVQYGHFLGQQRRHASSVRSNISKIKF